MASILSWFKPRRISMVDDQIKQEVYVCGKQYNPKDEPWNDVENAVNNVRKDVIGNLTSSVDKSLLSLVQKDGGYIKH